MKKLHILSTGFLIILMILSGCNEDKDNIPENGSKEIMTFSILHPRQERMTRVTETAFEANDRIGLFITGKDNLLEVAGNYVNNAALTYNGSQWSTAKPIYWDNGTYNIYAYYPYANPITSVDDYPFSVATDQNGTGYTASDFLWVSKTGITASGTPIALQFRHRMSRLLIKLIKGDDYEGDLPEDAEVYIHSTVPDATIDLSAGIVTRNPHKTAQSIRAKSLGEHKYSAILVPQRLDNRQPLVEVIMKGVSYLYESKFLFKPGIQHSVQLAVSKNPEQVKIEIGGEIENWE
mgnify:CR=1 FL=1